MTGEGIIEDRYTNLTTAKKNWFSTWLPPILLTLVTFGIAASGLDYENLWEDEAWSVWAARGSLPETWQRAAADIHPPLYFFALNGWARLTGESVYAVRLLSTAFGILGLATTYTLAKRLFDDQIGWMAMLLLGTSSFFIYYTREARMYTLLVYLAAMSMWVYLRWLSRPTPTSLAIYSVTIAALAYTHYYGLLIPLTQGVHLLLTQPRRMRGWFGAGGLGLLLYLPWLPILLQQYQTHANQPLALPIPANSAIISWLPPMLSSGAGLWLLVPFLLGTALLRLPRHKQVILLLGLWLLLTPLVGLALNTWGVPFYHARYAIAVLPAVALLVAYGIRQVWWRPIATLLLLWFVYVSLSSYQQLWPAKTSWDLNIIRQAIETRQPGEPSLVMIARDYSVEAYVDRQLGIRNSDTLDLSEGQYSPAEIHALVDSLDTDPSVWVIMPTNVNETWTAVSALDTQRHISYRDNVSRMLFYRFEQGDSDNLHFYFGDKFRYDGELFSTLPYIQPGETFCLEVSLVTLTTVDDSLSYGVHLVNPANVLVAQHDEGIGKGAAGEQIRLTPCLSVSVDLPPGDYYLHLVVYTWADSQRLPIFEGETDNVSWGDALVLGVATVE